MNKQMNNRRSFLKLSTALGFGLSGIPAIAKDWINMNIQDDDRIIDIHQHTDYLNRSHKDLLSHQLAMGISHTILLPSGHPISYGSTHYGVSNGLQAKATPNEICYEIAAANSSSYSYGANEVPDAPNAIAEIEKYLQKGACVIGELKFNIEIDSKEMQRIYQLAEAYDVPVLLHFQHKMYNWGFERLHKMLKKYKKVRFIGHAQSWWANIDSNHKNQNVLYPKGPVTAGGLTDMLLTRYDNVYGDLSAGSGLSAMNRDEAFTRGFLERHQDKLLYGSDCPDAEGEGSKCTGWQMIETIKKFSPNKIAERKIFFENANKVFKLKL